MRNTAHISKSGFTLVELLVVISIIGVLAAVITLVINPLELIHRSRDATRLKDLNSLTQAINIALQEGSLSNSSSNDLYELDTAMESDKYRAQTAQDGGDSADYYETGSNLNLIANSGGSCEY